MKKIELVGVQRLLNRVDNHIHLIVSIQFGNLVAGTDSATLALFEVARTPRAFNSWTATALWAFTPVPNMEVEPKAPEHRRHS